MPIQNSGTKKQGPVTSSPTTNMVPTNTFRQLVAPKPPVATVDVIPDEKWDFLPKGRSKDFIVSFCLEMTDGFTQPRSTLRNKLKLSAAWYVELGRLWKAAEKEVAAQFRDEQSSSSAVEARSEMEYFSRLTEALLDNFIEKIESFSESISVLQVQEALVDIVMEKSAKLLRYCLRIAGATDPRDTITDRVNGKLFCALDRGSELARKLVPDSHVKPIFYGTGGVGQRMLFQLYKAVLMGEQNCSSVVTGSMAYGANRSLGYVTNLKESLPFVSNYWLTGDVLNYLTKELILRSQQMLDRKRSPEMFYPEQAHNVAPPFTTSYSLSVSKEKSSVRIKYNDDVLPNRESFIGAFLAMCEHAYPVFVGESLNLGILSKQEPKSNLQQICRDLILRRVSKWFFYQAVRAGNLKVYYSLDEIDITAVARGDRVEKIDSQTSRVIFNTVPICSSELRELFRHWYKLNGKVQFVLFGMLVGAPWGASLIKTCENFMQLDRNPGASERKKEIETVFLGGQVSKHKESVLLINTLWAEYALELARKDGNNGLIEGISSHNQEQEYAKSVELFHSTPRNTPSPLDDSSKPKMKMRPEEVVRRGETASVNKPGSNIPSAPQASVAKMAPQTVDNSKCGLRSSLLEQKSVDETKETTKRQNNPAQPTAPAQLGVPPQASVAKMVPQTPDNSSCDWRSSLFGQSVVTNETHKRQENHAKSTAPGPFGRR